MLALLLASMAAAIAHAGAGAAAPALAAGGATAALHDQPVSAAVPSAPAGPPSPAAAVPAPEEAIPQGTALWFACTQPQWGGPAPLSCPRPYDPRYTSTFLHAFQRFTPENEFKMAFLEPQQNQFDFSLADQVALFARSTGKTVRGHTLVWNQELPQWVTAPLLPWTHDSLLAVMRSYISAVVGHFARSFPGLVGEWDVVNEPLDEEGNLQANLWENVIGPEYIADALEAAHAADPSARLLINDEGTELPGPKAMAMLALARSLKQAGVPLDAVGFESHVTPGAMPSLGYLIWLMGQYAAAGIDVEITELDVADDGFIDNPAAKQEVFRRYALACHVARNCIGFSVWGVADPYSWLGPGSDALMYDANFRPRPVVAVIRRLLAHHAGLRHARRRSHGHRTLLSRSGRRQRESAR